MNAKIYWPGIYAVTALNAAILICWLVYHFFQPGLLSEFGLTKAAKMLETSELIIFIMIPPISGYLADKFFRKNGNRFLIFTIGISFTSLIFFASAYAFLDNSPAWLKSAIPYCMILWLIGMNIFYSPATGFILNSVKKEYLPLAVASITLSTNLIFALSDPFLNILSKVGSSMVFILGALILITSSLIYYRVSKFKPVSETIDEVPKNDYIPVIIGGLFFGILEILGNRFLPDVINPYFNGILGDKISISMIVFIIAALLAFPLCYKLMKYSKANVFYFSWSLSISAMLFLYFFPSLISGIVVAIILSFSVSAFGVIAFPYALSKIKSDNNNFCSGLFLSASGIASAVVAFLN